MEREVIQKKELIEFFPRTSICFICKGRVVNVQYNEITHVSKYGNETVIYTTSISYRTYHSLQEILNDLPVNDFIKAHRSHIVSLKWMAGVKKMRIVVGGYYVPVSKYYRMQMIKRIGEVLEQGYSWFSSNTNC